MEIENKYLLLAEHMNKAPLATSIELQVKGVNNVRRVRVLGASKVDTEYKFLLELQDLVGNLGIGNYDLIVRWEFIDELLSMYETTIRIGGEQDGCHR